MTGRSGNNRRRLRFAQPGHCRRVRGWVVGAGGMAVVAFLALPMTPIATAPCAHADGEDLIIQPILDAINMMDQSFLASFDPGLADGVMSPALAAASSADLAGNLATIPLQMDGLHPVVDVSIGVGSQIPVVVDTGSIGLVVPLQDAVGPVVGSIFNPSDWASDSLVHGTFANGLEYWAVQVPTNVGFGNDLFSGNPIGTGQTYVDAIYWAQDNSAHGEIVALGGSSAFWNLFGVPSLSKFFGDADGVLGIGAHAPGPGVDVLTALPSPLNEAFVINEPQGVLQFGSKDSLDAFYGGTFVCDACYAPFREVGVQIGNGGIVQPHVEALFDSGGGAGFIPSGLAPGVVGNQLPTGTEITVFNDSHQELYQYATTSPIPIADYTDSAVSSEPLFNTGNEPFSQFPLFFFNS